MDHLLWLHKRCDVTAVLRPIRCLSLLTLGGLCALLWACLNPILVWIEETLPRRSLGCLVGLTYRAARWLFISLAITRRPLWFQGKKAGLCLLADTQHTIKPRNRRWKSSGSQLLPIAKINDRWKQFRCPKPDQNDQRIPSSAIRPVEIG